MTIKIYEKPAQFMHGAQFEGGRDNAMEICRWVGSGSSYIPATKEDPRDYVQVPTMFGPRDVKKGMWVFKIDDENFLTYKDESVQAEFKLVEDEDQRLIKHARYELSLFKGEDPQFIESIMNAVKGFCSFRGHSGSSAGIAIHMLNALLQGQSLMPLTNNPEEWELQPGEKYGYPEDLWQNKRNSSAISKDGGKTYFLVEEMSITGEQTKIYTSDDPLIEPEIAEEDLQNND